jgi:hypothetical protein
MNSRTVEIVSLALIAIIVAGGGRTLLAIFGHNRAFAAIVIVALIIFAIVGLRRMRRQPGDDARLVITKYVAYLVAAFLVLTDVLYPAKWVPGSCIAAAELALVFDMITIAMRKQPAQEV